MARSTCWVVLGIALASALPLVADDENGSGWSYDENLRYRSEDGNFELDLVNRVQGRLSADNPEIGDSGRAFELNRYRLMFTGRAFQDWKFLLQSDLATGSRSDDETDSNLLLDASVTFARKRLAQVWVGQGKVGFGRQFLIDSGNLQFVDRSIVTERFVPGRDVGVALIGENEAGTYGYSVGLYNGNGINEAPDESSADFLSVARLVVMPLGPMPEVETDPGWRSRPEPRLSIGVAGVTTTIGDGSFEEERINTGSLEFAFRVRGFTMVGEFFTESRNTLTGPPAVEEDTDGWYAQAGYAFPVGKGAMFEIAGRYAEILLDAADSDETETGGALGFYLRGHRQKIQVDYRALRFEGIPFGDRIDTNEGRIQLQLVF
jgi:hypothetical protein